MMRETRAEDAAEATDAQAGSPTVASRRIAEHLRQMILDDRLLPGERIRQEAVAEQLGASRLPVREALRILESEGLATLKANSGAWVARMDLVECQTIYKIRERVEPLALTESMNNLTDSDIAGLERIQSEIESGWDVERFLVLDRELHLRTYSGCQIRQLADMVHRFWNTTQHYRRAFVRLNGPDQQWIVNAEHRLLIEAIKRRDPTDAEQILSGHIRRTRHQLALHPELFDRPAPPSSDDKQAGEWNG
ncbi:GntR family transcriptional regulator [Catellatospora tritici]|uniref:GntR family transcriptional regulator n=1 Tax=Catellatospora tritici TaxID=2851566 RepID=UPI0020C4102F|nr:GntR family transcriptional regulator [Catellatospora tritici]